jgi:hypothetical protein
LPNWFFFKIIIIQYKCAYTSYIGMVFSEGIGNYSYLY